MQASPLHQPVFMANTNVLSQISQVISHKIQPLKRLADCSVLQAINSSSFSCHIKAFTCYNMQVTHSYHVDIIPVDLITQACQGWTMSTIHRSLFSKSRHNDSSSKGTNTIRSNCEPCRLDWHLIGRHRLMTVTKLRLFLALEFTRLTCFSECLAQRAAAGLVQVGCP